MPVSMDIRKALQKLRALKGMTQDQKFIFDFKRLMAEEPRKIKIRTLAGRDKYERGFAPYKATYKAKKDTTGKIQNAKRETRGAKVTLYGTGKGGKKQSPGHMLDSLQADVESSDTSLTGKVFVSAAQGGKARGHITGAGNLPQRDFLGFSKGLAKQINSLIRKYISLKSKLIGK